MESTQSDHARTLLSSSPDDIELAELELELSAPARHAHEAHPTLSAGRRVHNALKRLFDVSLSFVMLLALLPVSLVLMTAIKLEDGGPVFYSQERWGRHGSRLRIRKFRSMIPNADAPGVIKQASADDDRITRVGRVMRKMGLDEIPQLFHILVGHMSFVGPRALAVNEVVADSLGRRVRYEQFEEFRMRLHVRPGLTGLAAIYLPKDAPPEEKFRVDLDYIARQSLLLDLRLIVLSFWISFRGRWETRDTKVGVEA